MFVQVISTFLYAPLRFLTFYKTIRRIHVPVLSSSLNSSFLTSIVESYNINFVSTFLPRFLIIQLAHSSNHFLLLWFIADHVYVKNITHLFRSRIHQSSSLLTRKAEHYQVLFSLQASLRWPLLIYAQNKSYRYPYPPPSIFFTICFNSLFSFRFF